tara:strand:+ start:3404 stop:3892 length:489 start_codon:yes stop_codon:yes gene_type:complete
MNIINKYLVVCIFTIILASCGYHLRGSIDFEELDNVRLISDNRNSFSIMLDKRLMSNEQSNISQYPAIKIISVTSQKRQLSVNSSGRVDEYEITKTLNYQFIFSETNIFTEKLKASDSYDFNESQMQGTKEKEVITNNSIDRQLVRKLLSKFRSAKKTNLNQ